MTTTIHALSKNILDTEISYEITLQEDIGRYLYHTERTHTHTQLDFRCVHHQAETELAPCFTAALDAPHRFRTKLAAFRPVPSLADSASLGFYIQLIQI